MVLALVQDCKFPNLKATSAYAKGCKCPRCLAAHAEYNLKWYEKNPDKKMSWKKNNPELYSQSQKATRLKAEYGLTLEEREAMGNECAICTSHRKPKVDHDHSTGKIRDILCGKCNSGVGMFDDSPSRLRAAADYLERHGKK